MAGPLVSDELWTLIEPLIPVKRRRARYPGRRPLPDRRVLTGILFVLSTGIPWERLPKELGCGLGMTCWRRLRDWQHRRVAGPTRTPACQAERRRRNRLDTCRRRLRARASCFGGEKTGPSPVDRAKAGSKHHLITDGWGIPLACLLTAANRNDVTQLLELVEAIPAVCGKRGRPRKRPETVIGDRGYDSNVHRQQLRDRHIKPLIAKRNTAHGSGLGKERWVVERTLSWLHQYRRPPR
jgi:transposase